jgi:hypothetical protein
MRFHLSLSIFVGFTCLLAAIPAPHVTQAFIPESREPGQPAFVTNAAPPNDDFNNALIISSVPYSHQQATISASTANDDPSLSCIGNAQGFHTVWYRYTPSTSGTLLVDTYGSNYNTVLAIWTGTPGVLRIKACDDDSGADGSSSRVEIPVVAGTAYHIEVVGLDSEEYGTLSLNADCRVDIATIQTVANLWRQTGQPYDCDGDGVITIADVMCVVAHWGQSCSTPATSAGGS